MPDPRIGLRIASLLGGFVLAALLGPGLRTTGPVLGLALDWSAPPALRRNRSTSPPCEQALTRAADRIQGGDPPRADRPGRPTGLWPTVPASSPSRSVGPSRSPTANPGPRLRC